MNSIKTYSDTKKELEIANLRLGLLLNRKEELYVKYVGVKSPALTGTLSTSNTEVNNMSIYINKLHEADILTGLSIEQEIENKYIEINTLKNCLELMSTHLKELKGIEYKLYCKIIVEGYKPTKAVEKLAIELNCDTSTLWRKYNKIKKYVKC